MAGALSRLVSRVGYQSQNITSTTTTVSYWGYASRVVPCVKDAGTCEYFEAVYHGHEIGMLYSGILWCTILGLLLLWAISRHFWAAPKASETVSSSHLDPEKSTIAASATARSIRAFASIRRSYLLPDSIHWIFGRTTRLQVVILLVLVGYLTIFSFAGIIWGVWKTPVTGYTPGLMQTRSSLGPWADRVGTLAYALTPFSVLLSSRESILSVLTGIPYQSFNFLHRWLGWLIFIQSLLHTIGWTLVESYYYQPQPLVANTWIKQLYMIWGCVAMILLFILVVLATPWGIRLTGYEFFRKSHYILAMVYIGACYGHWEPLKCFMVPGLVIWFVDRLIRIFRSALIHYQYLPDGTMGFKTASANVTIMPDAQHGDVVRLDYQHPQDPWKPGQHFYICFTAISIWQSHPFTPLSLPIEENGAVTHSYIFRAKKGETKKIADLASKKMIPTTPVVMQGPYGENLTANITPDVNVIAVAGGTGITFVLPVILWLIRQDPTPGRNIMLIWSVRRHQDLEWVRPELDLVLAAAALHGITVQIHATHDKEEGTTTLGESPSKSEKVVAGSAIATDSSASSSYSQGHRHEPLVGVGRPDLSVLVPAFVEGTIRGRTIVLGSGPGGMISKLRSQVAILNSATRVWRGEAKYDVELLCDDRLEW